MAAKKTGAKKTASKKKTAKATRKAAATKAPARRKPARKTAGTGAAKRRALKARRQPETLRLRALTPGLTVNDVAASLAWYCDTLGFVVKHRWEHDGRLAGAELQAGSVRFYLLQDDWKKGRERSKGEGFRMYCTTAQDVDALAAAVRARGGELEYEPIDQPWGGRAFGVLDPDGFRLTIVSES